MTDRSTLISIGLLILFVAALIIGPAMCYTVSEREFVVVTQFGKPVAERTEPGLYFKTPFIEEVVRLPRTRQFWIGSGSNVLVDLPTKEGNKIDVEPWAIWRVKAPLAYVSQLGSGMETGEQRVASIVRSVMRDVITQYDLANVIRSTNRKLMFTLGGTDVGDPIIPTELGLAPGVELPTPVAQPFVGRSEILNKIQTEASARLATILRRSPSDKTELIEIVDVGISRIEFAQSVQKNAFERQRTRMLAIAARYSNEGERMKQEILNATTAEVQRIVAEGQKQANIVRGEADAYSIQQFAAAMRELGEFYTFVRTLEAYKKAFRSNTRIILTTDSEFLRLLKELPESTPDSAPSEVQPTPDPVRAAEGPAPATSTPSGT